MKILKKKKKMTETEGREEGKIEQRERERRREKRKKEGGRGGTAERRGGEGAMKVEKMTEIGTMTW